MQGRSHQQRAVDDIADMTNEAGIENRIDRLAVKTTALGPPFETATGGGFFRLSVMAGSCSSKDWQK
jgi:hypothetical protein